MQFKTVEFQDSTYNTDLLENQFKLILNNKNDEIIEATNKEINDISLADLNDKFLQRRIKLENYILDFFGSSIPLERVQYFLKNPKEFEYARNRELYKSSFNRIKEFKRKQIDSFNFNTKEIDLLIQYKKNNFILKEIFFKNELSSSDIKFLKLLGYKTKSGKLIL